MVVVVCDPVLGASVRDVPLPGWFAGSDVRGPEVRGGLDIPKATPGVAAAFVGFLGGVAAVNDAAGFVSRTRQG